MRRLLIGVAFAGLAGCFDSRQSAVSGCGTFGELCPVPVDSNLVEAITTAWLLEIDPLYPRTGPMMIGAGGDSAWTVAVYRRLMAYRPEYFATPTDTLHAPHLTGVSIQVMGDTVQVTTSISQCLDRESTFNWRETGLAHKFVPFEGQWALLPGSLAHLANGKC